MAFLISGQHGRKAGLFEVRVSRQTQTSSCHTILRLSLLVISPTHSRWLKIATQNRLCISQSVCLCVWFTAKRVRHALNVHWADIFTGAHQAGKGQQLARRTLNGSLGKLCNIVSLVSGWEVAPIYHGTYENLWSGVSHSLSLSLHRCLFVASTPSCGCVCVTSKF